ncbi:putative CHY and RING finger domain protein [Cladophialophora carrionii]|uniref:Putative CHY and RING finger domain protein n=1 Tax=Cladophialophora carrionii TaxID=86049 RepID=A0A1C1CU18_9EURO|nr:putative CHY and RING finger domain protein [Cladophialophora carrionii]
MSEYLPSFIVEPVLRQARRFSRLSTTAEESPGFLPAVPDLQRWSPARFWTTSPPLSLEDPIVEPTAESRETTVQSITRTIQLWAAQLNSFDTIPSPLLEPMDDLVGEPAQHTLRQEPSTTEFPALEPDLEPPPRPVRLEALRNDSETSLNPANELSYQSRVHEDNSRPHATSDPVAAPDGESTRLRRATGTQNGGDNVGGRRRDGSGTLPEDDGMGALRQKISAIWSGPGTAAEKSKLVHGLMMERYQKGHAGKRSSLKALELPHRSDSPTSTISAVGQEINWSLTEKDLQPTYAPVHPDDMNSSGELAKPALGCVHYIRNVKMQCSSCERWYTCRLCHDEAEDHTLPRRETKYMLCMLCNTPQAVGQVCKKCQVPAAHYYCPICKLWNNDPDKSVYHCDDCGICRLGEGLGKDFFHCKTCAACMSIAAESTHKCIERSTKSDCPICGEYMFTSNKPVAFMRCGHSIHEACFADWCNTSYKCPICSKSIANMESQFRRLDRHIEEQPMPEEYRDNRAYIFCNDCNSRSVTSYHWLGLKCTICESYNTAQLELLGAGETPQLQEQQQQAQQAGTSEAALTASQSHTPTGELTQPVDIARAFSEVQPRPVESRPTSGTPLSRSSWLLPHSPTARSTRSMSPVVGSYFGTGPRSSGTPEALPSRRGTTPLDDDDDLDFWGRPYSPRRGEAEGDDSESGSESESDPDDLMEDDDDEEDAMDLIGHR